MARWNNKIEFARSIKKVHPEYRDMADEELADKVLAKYPEEYGRDIGDQPYIQKGSVQPDANGYVRMPQPGEITLPPKPVNATIEQSPVGRGNPVPNLSEQTVGEHPEKLLKLHEMINQLARGRKTLPSATQEAIMGGVEAGAPLVLDPANYVMAAAGEAATPIIAKGVSTIAKEVPAIEKLSQFLTQKLGKSGNIPESTMVKEEVIFPKPQEGVRGIFTNLKKPQELAARDNAKFWTRFRSKSETFEKARDEGIANVIKRGENPVVDLSDVGGQMNAIAPFNAGIKTVLSKNKVLQGYIDESGNLNTELLKDVPIKEAQSILNEVKKTIPKGAWNGVGAAPHIDTFKIVNNINNKIASVIPEMKQAKLNYSKDWDVFNQISGYFKSVPDTESAIRQGFNPGNLKSQQEMLDRYFDKSTIKELGGYKRAYSVLQAIKKYWLPTTIGGIITAKAIGATK